MRQKSIEVPGMAHAAPIPNACRIGPILATSGVSGQDRATGKFSTDPDRQAYHCFENLRAVLQAGGMDMGDVVKFTVYVKEEAHRAAIGKYWEECFPDPHHRPARHVLVSALRGEMLIQLEVLAVAKDI